MHPQVVLMMLLLGGCAAAPRAGRGAPLPPAEPAPPVVVEPRLRAAADRSPPVAAVAESPASGGVTFRTVTWLPASAAVSAPAEDPPPEPVTSEHRRPSTVAVRHRRIGPSFPVGTLIGAGAGRVIGRHHGHASRGAWIGAGVGLLFDLQRW